MNTTVVICILAFWAVLATIFMVAALRSRADTQRQLWASQRRLATANAAAETWRAEAMARKTPARDGSDGIARTLRKITGPVRPSSARTPSTSRNDANDSLLAAAYAPTFAPASVQDTSCDTSSTSSSSSDGGSCGGGE